MSETSQPTVTEPNQETKKEKTFKKLVIFGVSLLCLAIILVGSLKGYKYHQHSVLVKSYNEEFNSILVESKLYSKKISNPPEELKTFNALVSYYQQLKSENNFDAQLSDLNASPKYISLKGKMDVPALALHKPNEELDQLIKDIDIIQIAIQKSKDVENEIGVLQSTTSTIDQFDNKIDDLTVVNEEIKNDMLGTVVHPLLKKAHENFIKALTYRGSYLSESKAANDAYLEAILAEDNHKQQVQLANKYIREGDSNYFFSQSYYDQASEANIIADNQSQKAKEKYVQQKTHAKEAVKMYAKYLELMGEYVSPVEKIDSTTAQTLDSNEEEPSLNQDIILKSDQQVKEFVVSYINKAVEATREYDFSTVEPFFDTEGKSYKESKDYLKYLQSKGIHEELINIDVTNIDKQTEYEYIVSTTESYSITYKDGSLKIKSFISRYKIVTINNGLYVNALISTKEI